MHAGKTLIPLTLRVESLPFDHGILLPPDQEDHLAAIAANAGAPSGFTFLATIALPGERGRMTRAS
jgi:hypothetical protein